MWRLMPFYSLKHPQDGRLTPVFLLWPQISNNFTENHKILYVSKHTGQVNKNMNKIVPGNNFYEAP